MVKDTSVASTARVDRPPSASAGGCSGRRSWHAEPVAEGTDDETAVAGAAERQLTAADWHWLSVAREQAELGAAEGGVPVGAALVAGPRLLGVGRNRRVQEGSAIRHGETDAVERAGRQPAMVYRTATLYSTLSPCDLCTGLVLLYGIPRLVVGEQRSFRGPVELLVARGVQVLVADDASCRALMATFIAARPDLWYEDIGTSPSEHPSR